RGDHAARRARISRRLGVPRDRRGPLMRRRDFIRTTGLAAFGATFARVGPGSDRGRTPTAEAAEDGWRVFEITTRVEIRKPAGRTRVWLPTPLVDTPYQRTLGDTYRADGGFVEMAERPGESLDMLVAEWPDGAPPVLELTSRVTTHDHRVDL